MKASWYDFYLDASVRDVVKVFRKHGFNVDFNEELAPHGHARGYIEKGGSGMVLNPKVFRKGIRSRAGSCVEISTGSKDFNRVREVIKKEFKLV